MASAGRTALPPRYPSTGVPSYGEAGNRNEKVGKNGTRSVADRRRNEVARARGGIGRKGGRKLPEPRMTWEDFSAYHTESGEIPQSKRIPAFEAQQKFKQRNIFASHFQRLTTTVKDEKSEEEVKPKLLESAKKLEKLAETFGMSIIPPSKPKRVRSPTIERNRHHAVKNRIGLKIRSAQSFYAGRSPDDENATEGGAGPAQPKSVPLDQRTIRARLESYLTEPPETPAERWMNQVWLRKRLKDVEEARRALEVQHAIDQWAISRSRLEEEITHRQEVRRFVHRPQSAKARFGSQQPAEDKEEWVPHPIVLDKYAYSAPRRRPSSALPQRTTSEDLTENQGPEAGDQRESTADQHEERDQRGGREEVPVALPRHRPVGHGGHHAAVDGNIFENLLEGMTEYDTNYELEVHRQGWERRKVHVVPPDDPQGEWEDIKEDTSELDEDHPALDSQVKDSRSQVRPASAMESQRAPQGKESRPPARAGARPASAPVRFVLRSNQPNLLFEKLNRHKAAVAHAQRLADLAKAKAALELEQGSAPPAATKGGKKKKKGGKGKGKGKKKSAGKAKGETTTSSTPTYPPSALEEVPAPPVWLMSDMRKEQLSECEAIQARFEAKGMSVPLDVLERALVVPEDRPDSFCTQFLPMPGGKLEVNPLLAEKRNIFGGKAGVGSKLSSPKKKAKGKAKKAGGKKKKGKKKK